LIFWATGAVTILMLSVLAYATVYGRSGTEAGINFLIFAQIFINPFFIT